MYLNTLGKNEMYQSVAEMLGTDIETIKQYVMANLENIIDCNYDEHSIETMDLEPLLKRSNCIRPKKIDSLTVNHITPREDIDSVWQEGLLTLPHTLTKRTALSEYLRELGFEFLFNGKQITMKRYGKEVDIDRLQFSNLKMRLGGDKTLNDFNVNGYLFVNEFEIDAVRGWLGSPEFLKSLAVAYSKNSIADKYADHCRNYYVSFEVPLEMVDIEGFSEWIDEDTKTWILLKYTINALAYSEMKRKPFLPMYNSIILLKRNYDVPSQNIRKIWTFRYERNKIIPIS